MKKSVELYTCLWGLLLCAGALLVNDWVLEALFCCPDGMPDHFRLNFRVYAAVMAAVGLALLYGRKKNMAQNGALLLSSLVVIGLGTEIYLRLFDPQDKGRAGHETLFELHQRWGWRFKAGAKGEFSAYEYRTPVAINRAGMRDRDYAPEPSGGKRRIAVLGDSFVSGLEVPMPEVFTEVMEEKLLPGTEVLNFGVNGFGPPQSYLLLRDMAIYYRPRLVVLVIYLGNDLDDISGVSDWLDGYRRPRPVMDGGRLRILPPVEGSPPYGEAPKKNDACCRLPQSHLANLVERFTDNLKQDKYVIEVMPSELRFCGKNPDERTLKAYELLIALLSDMDVFCRNHDARLAVVAAPTLVQVYEKKYWRKIVAKYQLNAGDYDLAMPGRELGKACATAGIPFLDLAPAMKSAAAEGKKLYYPRNQHWTPLGHAVVARRLARFIEDELKNGN